MMKEFVLILYFLRINESIRGGLAQLARAPALQAGGRRFESDILHTHTVNLPKSFGSPVFRFGPKNEVN